jgi:long-subunit fatty acid transport protein
MSHFWRRISAVFSTVVCSLTVGGTLAWADGVMFDGVTPRSVSRGGTNQGFADNGGIIFDNPGAMVNIDGCGLMEVGADMLFVSGHYADPDDNNVYSTTFTPLPQIAIIQKTPDGNFAYGFGIFTPAGFSERFNMQGPAPLTGQRRYETFGALAKILPAVSCRVTDQLSIGATLGMGVSYAELQGPYFLNDSGPLHGLPIDLRTHGFGADVIWSFGAQYLVDDDTTIGATYQSSSPFVLHGNSNVVTPGLGQTSYDSDLHVEWPQSVALGIRHALCPHRTIAADVVWYDWSHAFDNFELDLNHPTNGGFPPSVIDHFPLDWRDGYSFRLGYEQQLDNGITLRLGYDYHPNPIPDATLTPFIQGILTHTFTVGLSKEMYGWDVDLGYVHMFAPTVHVGTSQLAGGDFSNSTQNMAVDAILLSFMKKY